jgi:hypothetical protein
MPEEANAAPTSLAAQLDRVRATYRDEQTRLHMFVHNSQRWIERDSEVAGSALAKLEQAIREGKPIGSETGPMDLSPDEIQTLREVVGKSRDAAARYPTMLLNMALIYAVALFEAYISDALAAVLQARPEMLKTRQKHLSFEAIVVAETKGASLVPELVARELGEVSFTSFDDQVAYYRERFGLTLEDSGVALEDLREVMARRNVLVHNAGIVNERYRAAVPDSPLPLGERADVDADYWERAHKAFGGVVSYTATCLSSKFGDQRPEGG